jgi:FtsH-binding integral membrane protein
VNIYDDWNLTPDVNLDLSLKSNESKISGSVCGCLISDGEYFFTNIYPGSYTLKIRYKSFTKEESVQLPYDGSMKVIFPAKFHLGMQIFDARGYLLKDAKVKLTRDGLETETTTQEDGNAAFSIPPGQYVISIFSGDNLIAKRKVDVLNEKHCKFVTDQDNLPLIITIITIVILIGVAFISYKKRDMKSFLKVLAVALIVIALISPWWTTQGSSPDNNIESNSKIYLIPLNLITITSAPNVTAGEPEILPQIYTEPVSMIAPLLIFGSIFIVLTIFLKRLPKKKSSSFLYYTFFIAGGAGWIYSTIAYYLATTVLAGEGVGSLFGSGAINVNIPGEGIYETLNGSWGLDVGFYLTLIALAILVIIFIFDVGKSFLELKRKKAKITK